MKKLMFVGKIVLLIVLVLVGVWSGKFTGLMHGAGLAFVLLGGLAMALMGFSLPEIGTAFRHAAGGAGQGEALSGSAYFWEAAARNFLLCGVLGTMAHFIVLMGHIPGIGGFFSGLAQCFLSTLYGVILAVICCVPSLTLRKRVYEELPPESAPENAKTSRFAGLPGFRFEHVIGYALFVAIMAWILMAPGTLKMFSHWSALLVVVGGSVILVMLLGDVMGGRAVTLSFAFTGFIGALMGLIQFLHSLTGGSIQAVASAISFSVLSCYVTLVGIMFIGLPLEDRAVRSGKNHKSMTFSRIVWYGFPLVALIFLVFAVVMILTPISRK